MYYTKLKPDLEKEEAASLQDIFGIPIYNPEPPDLRENSLLSFVNTRTISLDKKDNLLLFNSELATWVFLEGKERLLYDYLREGVRYSTLLTASLLKINGLGGKNRLNNLLAHLYDRGMLSVDGKTGINQEVNVEGPLFRDIPMMELLVTGNCNLGCTYCFTEANQKKQDMKLETALKAVDHLMELPFNNFCIKFSGGEPLLRKDLLKKTCQYTIEKFQQIKKEGYLLFEVTTNGTKIDREAVELFKRFNMRVLISIDGPETLHNEGRHYLNGSPSFEEVLKGIERMQAADYPFRVITVVARHNLSHAREIIDFFAQSGVKNLRFNPVLKHGRGKQGWQDHGIEPREYLSFMKTVAAHCIEDVTLHEDNIESLLRNMVYRTRNFKCMRSNCGCGHYYLCVNTGGDIFPCAYFLAETSSLRLGNIHEGVNFGECGDCHQLVKTLPLRNVDKIESCSKCQWRHLCEGGCTLGAYLKSGTIFAPTYLCDYFKGMYAFLFSLLAEKPDFILRLLTGEVKAECI
jgi:radical SAM protein with 4Fe4S-binding SPASM domain